MEKTCTKCKVVQTVDDFYRDARCKSGYRSVCKTCVNAKAREWQRNNPDRMKAISARGREKMRQSGRLKDRYLRDRFGITIEDYNRMLDEQNGACAICGRPETSMHQGKIRDLAVDHCHATGRVRGLLCGNCNNGLGRFEDDPDRMLAAAIYVIEHADERVPTDA